MSTTASSIDDYQVIETLNTGEFGSRQKISRISDGRLFEWREISYKSMDDALKEMVIYEINTLKKLRHPNIIHHEDAIVQRKTYTLYLITECAGTESLQTMMDQHRRKKTFIKEDLIWSVLTQFTNALHSLSIVQDPYRSQIFHRCLKPSSVYLNSHTQQIKIGDFGLGLISKPYYMCPELQKLGLCNEKSDVWSMGCIVYEMCTLKRPFREVEHDESQITDWRIGNIPNKYSRDLFSIIKFILTPDEEMRPSPLMVLHHPIFKARKEGAKIVNGGRGLLETNFPLSSKENLTVITEDSLEVSVVDSSGISLNQYLSMISEQDPSAVYIDDVDIQSIENGTAYPKATSSVLHASPSPFRENFDMPNRHQPLMSTHSIDSSLTSRKVSELFQLEAHLQRWAKMLEEKEQELSHKEKRLQLWETQLREMQKFSDPLNQSSLRNSFAHNAANESSGVESLETDMDSTTSAYPCDSILEPTAVRMEPSKIPNPFTRNHLERRVRFQRFSDESSRSRTESATKQFAEQRLHWLEMKKKKHLAGQLSPNAAPALPPKTSAKLETDYVFMEEKSIPVTAPVKRQLNKPPGLPIITRFETQAHAIGKENRRESLGNNGKCPPLPPRPISVRLGDVKSLTSELRAKLKSHNLPGLR